MGLADPLSQPPSGWYPEPGCSRSGDAAVAWRGKWAEQRCPPQVIPPPGLPVMAPPAEVAVSPGGRLPGPTGRGMATSRALCGDFDTCWWIKSGPAGHPWWRPRQGVWLLVARTWTSAPFSGGRLTLGAWLDEAGTIGVEAVAQCWSGAARAHFSSDVVAHRPRRALFQRAHTTDEDLDASPPEQSRRQIP